MATREMQITLVPEREPTPEEEIVAGVLRRNWHRISRYERPEDAIPALRNVAKEVIRALGL